MPSSTQPHGCRLVLSELAVRHEELISADEATDLAYLTWQHGIATGDSRYCVLSKSFRVIADYYEEFGVLPAASVIAAMREIRRALPGILNAASASDGARAAALLADSVVNRVSDWPR